MLSTGVALVTGATGFVGSALVRRLLQDGFDVRALSNGGARDRLADVESRVDWFTLDDSSIFQATSDVSHFFNFAVAYDRPAYSNEFIDEVNVDLPLRVLDALARPGHPVACVMGDSFYRKFPASATKQIRYTASKQRLAGCVEALPKDHPCRIALLLIEQVYGPGENLEKAYPRVARQMLSHVPRLPMSHGRQQRDFIHINDVVSAALIASQSDWDGTIQVGCGSGVATPVREVFEMLAAFSSTKSHLGFGDIPADQDIDMSVADTRWLTERGWEFQIPLGLGLQDFLSDVARRCSMSYGAQ